MSVSILVDKLWMDSQSGWDCFSKRFLFLNMFVNELLLSPEKEFDKPSFGFDKVSFSLKVFEIKTTFW